MSNEGLGKRNSTPLPTNLFDAPLLPQPSAVEKESEAQRDLRRLTAGINIAAFVGVVFSVVAVTITMGIIFTSASLNQDRKVFFACILGLCTLGLQVVIAVSRSDKTALLLFSTLSGYISVGTLCLAIPYTSS